MLHWGDSKTRRSHRMERTVQVVLIRVIEARYRAGEESVPESICMDLSPTCGSNAGSRILSEGAALAYP